VLNSYEVGTVHVADVDGVQRQVDYISRNGQITGVVPRDAYGFDLDANVPMENIRTVLETQN